MSKNKTVRNVFFTVFCLFACISLGYAESCSTAGATQNKYTASGCSYTTQSRTCCSNGAWSDWGGSCPTCNKSADTCDARQLYADFDEANCKCICPTGAIEVNGTCECDTANGYVEGDHECVKSGSGSCASNQCWNGSNCEAKGSTSIPCEGMVQETTGGTLTRTATCYSGSGWSYGSWTGTCTCPSGSTWTGSGLSGRCKGNYYWNCTSYQESYYCNGANTVRPNEDCYNYGETATGYESPEEYSGDMCTYSSCICK